MNECRCCGEECDELDLCDACENGEGSSCDCDNEVDDDE